MKNDNWWRTLVLCGIAMQSVACVVEEETGAETQPIAAEEVEAGEWVATGDDESEWAAHQGDEALEDLDDGEWAAHEGDELEHERERRTGGWVKDEDELAPEQIAEER